MYPFIKEQEDLIDCGNDSFITIYDFEKRFDRKQDHQFRYKHFINHENTTDAWMDIFKTWKEKGILN